MGSHISGSEGIRAKLEQNAQVRPESLFSILLSGLYTETNLKSRDEEKRSQSLPTSGTIYGPPLGQDKRNAAR